MCDIGTAFGVFLCGYIVGVVLMGTLCGRRQLRRERREAEAAEAALRG